eukprot:6127962-Pleurochrysis_carterae.AAC.1
MALVAETGNPGITPNIVSRTVRTRKQSQLQALMPKSPTREPKEEPGRACSDEDKRPAPEAQLRQTNSERWVTPGAISGGTPSC